MVPLLIFFLLSCSSKPFYDKWDYDVRRWYEEGKQKEREFKVLLRDIECFEKIKNRFKVVGQAPSTVIVVRLSREELVEISKDRCVKYIEAPKPVHLKSS